MKKHVDIEVLERYLDGELGPRKRRQVRRHLEGCADCCRQLELLDMQGALLRKALEEKAAEQDFSAMHERVMKQVRQQRPLPWTESLRAWLQNSLLERRAVFALSAAALVLLVAGWFWFGPRPGGVADTSPAAAVAAGSEQPPVIIDSLEYAGQRSLIYTVSRNNTTVIWLVDFDKAAQVEAQGEDL